MTADKHTQPVYISHAGPTLLGMPLLNKGTAFSERERHDFNLLGLVPHRFETIEQQAERAYRQFCSFDEPINRHIYLRRLQDNNETLFYYLLQHHLAEMMPIIYTPTVGEACVRFSELYRRARGLFVSYPDRHHLDAVLHNATKRNVKVIVVTDGSRILGLGDQGVGGMGISIGKLSLYTACGGISPAYTLPVMLDVGTDNPDLLNNPLYMGWQHRRISEAQYDEFMALFISALQKRWPRALLQFEDFEQRKALPLLQRYRDRICCFNDDIQGTAAVTVASLLAACRFKKQRLSEQIIVFAGAGSAGCGIAEQIVAQMRAEGLDEQAARKRIFMVDRPGLLTRNMSGLHDFQRGLAQAADVLRNWAPDMLAASLHDVVANARPTVLIGVSGQPGLFDETLIRSLHTNCRQPIIFPLSNPSDRVEARPEQLVEWTGGEAIIATGSPFSPVSYQGREMVISQCNNAYIFPGIGLGVVAAGITRISDEMLMAASEIVAAASPLAAEGAGPLLPPLNGIAELSRQIARAIARTAQQQGLAPGMPDEALHEAIARHVWLPRYRPYQRVSA